MRPALVSLVTRWLCIGPSWTNTLVCDISGRDTPSICLGEAVVEAVEVVEMEEAEVEVEALALGETLMIAVPERS